jgi:hypothetical protein
MRASGSPTSLTWPVRRAQDLADSQLDQRSTSSDSAADHNHALAPKPRAFERALLGEVVDVGVSLDATDRCVREEQLAKLSLSRAPAAAGAPGHNPAVLPVAGLKGTQHPDAVGHHALGHGGVKRDGLERVRDGGV